MSSPIIKGSIVKYREGHYRVKSLFKSHATLCGIFGGKIYHKQVPLLALIEDEKEWYRQWSKSETYQSM